jgi:hypothetical protein
MAPRRGSQFQGGPPKALSSESASFSVERRAEESASFSVERHDDNDLSQSGRSRTSNENENENSTSNQDYSGPSSRDLQGEDKWEQDKIDIADRVARDETQALRRLKQFAYRVVILVAVGLGLAAFFTTQADEMSAFQSGVRPQRMIDSEMLCI